MKSNQPKQDVYDIGYNPPIAVIDEPHRVLDTLDTPKDLSSGEAQDFGVIQNFGDAINADCCSEFGSED